MSLPHAILGILATGSPLTATPSRGARAPPRRHPPRQPGKVCATLGRLTRRRMISVAVPRQATTPPRVRRPSVRDPAARPRTSCAAGSTALPSSHRCACQFVKRLDRSARWAMRTASRVSSPRRARIAAAQGRCDRIHRGLRPDAASIAATGDGSAARSRRRSRGCPTSSAPCCQIRRCGTGRTTKTPRRLTPSRSSRAFFALFHPPPRAVGLAAWNHADRLPHARDPPRQLQARALLRRTLSMRGPVTTAGAACHRLSHRLPREDGDLPDLIEIARPDIAKADELLTSLPALLAREAERGSTRWRSTTSWRPIRGDVEVELRLAGGTFEVRGRMPVDARRRGQLRGRACAAWCRRRAAACRRRHCLPRVTLCAWHGWPTMDAHAVRQRRRHPASRARAMFAPLQHGATRRRPSATGSDSRSHVTRSEACSGTLALATRAGQARASRSRCVPRRWRTARKRCRARRDVTLAGSGGAVTPPLQSIIRQFQVHRTLLRCVSGRSRDHHDLEVVRPSCASAPPSPDAAPDRARR